MRWTNLSMTAAMATAVLVLLPVGSAAPAVITGGGNTCGTDPGTDPATDPADGSCNLVFRNEHDLAGLSPAELNETVKQSCAGFPDGPYRRIDSPNQTPIDYVTLTRTTPNGDVDLNASLDAGEINGQIGTSVASGVKLEVDISGTFDKNGASITIDDMSTADSQILDLGGFDFVLFEKSQGGGGGQVATLVCDINMWYRIGGLGSASFGLRNFDVDHGVNQITVGWVAGPSGHFSQLDAVAACILAGTGPLKIGGEQGTPSYLVGSYKSTTENPVSTINVTGCGLATAADVDNEVDAVLVLTAYCDGGEVAGSDSVFRPNACNPDGGTGGLPTTTSSGVTQSHGTCFFFGSGTPVIMPCPHL